MRCAPALLLALAGVSPGISRAQIYVAAEGAGVVLSNFRTAETPLLLLAMPAGPAPERLADMPAAPAGVARPSVLRLPMASAELGRIVADVARQVQIAPELLHAVIAAESRYDTRALSPRGAIGLMQLLPATARRFGARDPYVARENVLAGASYLKWLMAMFSDDLELVLAAYNAGEQAVLKAGGRIPPYPEAQAYVPRVLAYLRCAHSAACKPG